MAVSHLVVSQSFLSRRRLLAGGLALTGAGALAACSSGTASRAASASAAGGALTIGLTYTPNIQFAPFYMAKNDGTYATNVTLHHHGAQDGLFDALQSGHEQLVVAGADAAVEATKEHMDDLKVDQTQAKRAREVAVATGKLVSGDGSHPIGSVRVDDIASMIEFLTSHKLLGDKKTPKAAEVCVPLGQ